MRMHLFSFFVAPFLFVPTVSAITNETAPSTLSPAVAITTPFDGQEFSKDENVSVVFTVENFLFVDFKNNAEPFPGNPNAGHAHLWLDPPKGELPHDAARKLLSDDPVALGVLPKGEHRVVIELTQNHHVPFDPPAIAEVRFRVGSGIFGGVSGRGVSNVSITTDDIQFLAMAILAIGALWLLWQKGAVKWLVSWASWEKKKGPKPPTSAPTPPSSPPSPPAA